MSLCRDLDEVRAAALDDHDGPMDQNQADLTAAILATARPKQDAA